jgi:hypothetical protein
MVAWPDGKRFAFTIIDDTDAARLATVRPIYDLLADLGLRTTKTVWPLTSPPGTPLDGDTLDDEAHRAWIGELAAAGFEIAYHGAAAAPSPRAQSLAGLDRFRAVVGHDPRVYASHSGQTEAIYWGGARLTGVLRHAFTAANRAMGRRLAFHGEDEASPYFWGDLCRDRIEYVRNLTFRDIDTLACDPEMPSHDPRKPFVRYWFSASNGPTGPSFCELISEANQDRLLAAGGACIAYTHFAAQFCDGGRPRPEVVRLLTRLAALPGWFAPTSAILDHLRAQPGWRPEASARGRERMQWRWLVDNLRTQRGRRYLRTLRRRVIGR